MAKNTNKRIPVKWVRDRAKSAYTKQNSCYICGVEDNLELHHLASVTLLLNNWAESNKIDISTDENIIAVRDDFIEQHHTQIYTDVYTLCNKHHVALHSVYGKAPPLNSVDRQRTWIETQKSKRLSGDDMVKIPVMLTRFSSFVGETSFKEFI